MCIRDSFEILDPQLQLDFIEPVTGEVGYCESTEYVFEILNARQGPAFIDSIFVYIPLGPGFDFVPGSFEAIWPTGSGPVSIADPVPTGVSDLFMGNQYALTDFTAVLGPNETLPGVNIDPTQNMNSMMVSFEAVASCGYQDASLLQFQVNGTNICGETVLSNLNTSPRIQLFGLDTLLTNEYLIFLEPSLFSTCAGQEIFEVNILNDGPLSTSPDEQVCITIPDAVPLVAGSFNFFNPVSWDPAIEVSTVGPGIQQYCFFMPPGVPAGGVFSFEFEVDVAADVDCGIYPFTIQTLFEEDRICDFFESQEDCTLEVNTSLNTEFGVNLINSLSASNVVMSWDINACSASTPQVEYQLTATNNNFIDDFPANQASVSFYEDVNLNGTIDVGTDLLLASDVVSSSIPAGGQTIVAGSFDLSLTDFCMSGEYLIELSDNAGCDCGSESFPVEIQSNSFFGAEIPDTIVICDFTFELEFEMECVDSSGLFDEIYGLEPDEYFEENLMPSSFTDGAGNELELFDFFDAGPDEFNVFVERIEDDIYSTFLFLEAEMIQCSPDGIFKITYDIEVPSQPGCAIPFTLILECPQLLLANGFENEEVLCDMGDTVCVNLFDFVLFEDVDGNVIDPADPPAEFSLDLFTFVSIRNNTTNSFEPAINLDTISDYSDLVREVCISDDVSYTVFFSSGTCFNNATVSFSVGDGDPNFTQNFSFPEEICLGDDAEIINTHNGLFQSVNIISGDPLAIPLCNNLSVCDTIAVSPSITTTYELVLTDSLGCPHDTIFTINVRNTDAPLIVTVDDNLLCEGSSETAMVCINDSRASSIFTWQLDGVDIAGTSGQTCITVSASGVYSITAQDDLGCSLSGQNEVFIQPSPEPPALLFGDSTYCVGIDTITVATTLGFQSYEWFQITNGVTSPIASDVNSLEISQLGTQSFFVEVLDIQGCAGVSDTITITGQECFIDLELEKGLLFEGGPAPATLLLCDTVTYVITVENRTLQSDSLPLDATGVSVHDGLPTGLTYLSSTSTNGMYDPVTGQWNVGFLRNGRTDTLLIQTKLDSATTIYNIAEVDGHLSLIHI